LDSKPSDIGQKLGPDLEAESIDILDVCFLIEKSIGVPVPGQWIDPNYTVKEVAQKAYELKYSTATPEPSSPG